MTRIVCVEPVFVEFIPRELEPGKLYVSMVYTTTAHLCASGCGSKVVVPISPAQWQLCFDGETVSLSPSIGNWDLPCQAHYWIRRNKIQWSSQWDKKRIDAGRRNDTRAVDDYYDDRSTPPRVADEPVAPRRKSLWQRLFGGRHSS